MIHFAIGTKAQFVKTAPIMQRLAERGVDYRYIDFGQHSRMTEELRRQFGIAPPDVSLSLDINGVVATLDVAFQWTARTLSTTLRSRQQTLVEVFGGEGGVCVVLGDTLSTLLGLMAAKRAGLDVLLVEAGLASGRLLEPFPEEMTRRLCERWADYLAAPSQTAYDNLAARGYAAKTFMTPGNTGADALAASLGNPHERSEVRDEAGGGMRTPSTKAEGSGTAAAPSPYALISIHKFENIMSRRRSQMLVELAGQIAARMPVRFMLYDAIENRLQRYGLIEALQEKGVELVPFVEEHSEFLRLVHSAEFLITDGGSLQEECALLGIPCLLYRKRTERDDGLGKSVVISGLDPETISEFVTNYESYRMTPEATPVESAIADPSAMIAEFLINRGYA
jgi:UDP-N-acetylglucosamine 2-epimerase (non-hydrolysing)